MAMYGYEVFRHTPEYFSGNQMQEMNIIVRYIGESWPNARYPFAHGDRLFTLRFLAFSDLSDNWGTGNYEIERSNHIRLLKRAVALAERIEDNREYQPEMTPMQILQSAFRAANIVPIRRRETQGHMDYVEADEVPEMSLREWL